MKYFVETWNQAKCRIWYGMWGAKSIQYTLKLLQVTKWQPKGVEIALYVGEMKKI